MSPFTPASLEALAAACQINPPVGTPVGTLTPALPRRLVSIWEITSWILPMAPEHFRRVLAADPTLPQGTAGAEGGTRWFAQGDLVTLRAHFATGPRKARYQPPHAARAPLVTLTGPLSGLGGAMGRSTCLLHLATAAALSGYRILVIDGDPAGSLGRSLGAASGHGDVTGGGLGAGVVSLIARSAAQHLRRLNAARLDRGDVPHPMDKMLAASLGVRAADLIRPGLWPGLDVMAAGPALMQADLQIAGWRQTLRTWHPGRALVEALEEDGLRQRYDLILCDTPRGLGPLALALLTAADVLLAPLPVQDDGLARLGAGLQALALAATQIEAEVQQTARALGQSATPQIWPHLMVLPNCVNDGANAGARPDARPDASQAGGRLLAGFAAKLGDSLLPTPLPHIAALGPDLTQFYDLDYRRIGRLAYAPLRAACDAAWRGLAASLAPSLAPGLTGNAPVSPRNL